ncbi:PepSY domain-containing protein [Actinoplanes sp. NPDC048791]|uniref:PepSY domain-containing protein n=1 Tax=Actinoplanes sp. NPDC048791 TaxID=3154623 RepID=UPI0033D35C52
MAETAAQETWSSASVARAVDAALREAGGGRMAGVRIAYEFGRRVFVVQFVRGSWLCAATVDAATGEVLSILDEGPPVAQTDTSGAAGTAVTAQLAARTVWDMQPTVEDPAAAYVATDAGLAVVRLCRDLDWTLVVEDHHPTGFAAIRRLASVPGGVIAGTADGRMFRMDTAGRLVWETRMPGCPHRISADTTATRVLLATNAGTVELDARTGTLLGLFGGAARAAAFLANGDRAIAGHRGDLLVTTPSGETRWRMDQGELPERLWLHHDRLFVAGEGGVKEIVVGEGVVARWSVPGADSVDDAVVIDGSVFTISDGSRLDRHSYATAGYHAGPAQVNDPETITVLGAGRQPWLLVGHRDGRLSARPV